MNIKQYQAKLLFICPAILFYAQIFYFRDTFIQFWLAMLIFILGGAFGYLFFGRFISFYRNPNSSIGWQSLYGCFSFGSFTLFLFLTLNYYLPIKEKHYHRFKVIKTGHFGGRRISHDPYLVVEFNGHQKQLIFDPNLETEGCVELEAFIQQGCLGFYAIVNKEDAAFHFDELLDQHDFIRNEIEKIKLKAEEYASRGNKTKAIELYKRVLKFNKGDTESIQRLGELEN